MTHPRRQRAPARSGAGNPGVTRNLAPGSPSTGSPAGRTPREGVKGPALPENRSERGRP